MKALVVSIPSGARQDIELASDQLWQLGVRAIEERSVGDQVELWTAVGESDNALARASTGLGDRWEWRTEEVNVETGEAWRDFAGPMWVNSSLVVVPAWQEHSLVDEGDVDEGAVGEEDEGEGNPVVLRIEPGAAFGLGDHPTTELSLRALASLLSAASRPAASLSADSPPAAAERPLSVLDVGCGTGVIAIAAVRLGAGPVRAVDIASAAIEATTDNAARNGVAADIRADTTSVADLDGTYDIVVANILAPVLVHLADDLRRLTASGGHLVISGILADSHAHVLEALAPMSVVRREVLDGWIAVTLRH